MKCIRIYESWQQETAALTEAEKGRLIDNLIHYLITGEELPAEGNERIVFPLMAARIRQEQETHERTKERRKAEREDANK